MGQPGRPAQAARGVPLARRRRPDGAQCLVGRTQRDGDALVQRRCFGGVDLTEVSIHLSESADPTHACGAPCGRPWHSEDCSHWKTALDG
jgi:hypothetical protein